jgi:hypothetical protein
MEKWDYYISGIWKQTTGDKECISDVFLHKAMDGFGKGVKTSKEDVISLLKDGAMITTITWNYHLMQWRYGAKVEFGVADGDMILMTDPGAATFDDLESSIQMQYILDEQTVTSH